MIQSVTVRERFKQLRITMEISLYILIHTWAFSMTGDIKNTCHQLNFPFQILSVFLCGYIR